MRTVLIFGAAVGIALAQQGPEGPGSISFIRISPILNILDANQDGVISAEEIAGASAQLHKLDKNGDGKLSRDEAGLQLGRGGEGRRGGRGGDEAPASGPSAAELTETMMAFDANKNGQLEKSEVPERMQGMFDRGDSNHDGILTREEIAKLAEANRQQAAGSEGRRGGRTEGRDAGEGPERGGPGRGPGQFDLAFTALDLDRDGEISASEIATAATSLKSLDKNTDGKISEAEVTPQFGARGRGPGGPDRQR